MYNIRQEELFSLQELLEKSPKDTYTLVFETLDIMPFLIVVSKKSLKGKPTQHVDLSVQTESRVKHPLAE